jgi:sec-independent protein translocase protein TatA
MGGFSLWHILILAIVVLLLFGGNRFSNMMGDIAKGVKSFKAGMADDDEESRRRYEQQRQIPREQARREDPIDVTPRPSEPAAPPPPRDDEAR